MPASNALFTVLLLKHVYNIQLNQSSVTKEGAFRNVVDQITSQMSADITTQTHNYYHSDAYIHVQNTHVYIRTYVHSTMPALVNPEVFNIHVHVCGQLSFNIV